MTTACVHCERERNALKLKIIRALKQAGWPGISYDDLAFEVIWSRMGRSDSRISAMVRGLLQSGEAISKDRRIILVSCIEAHRQEELQKLEEEKRDLEGTISWSRSRLISVKRKIAELQAEAE
ncbi:MAG: hypothetical protein U9Q03_00625 [Patescibacteria group bacterium]|nr:hypothetical protein [Patescibacteria group bacterium]